MSHSMHFRSFRRRWGDRGLSQDCSRSQCWGWLPSATPHTVMYELHMKMMNACLLLWSIIDQYITCIYCNLMSNTKGNLYQIIIVTWIRMPKGSQRERKKQRLKDDWNTLTRDRFPSKLLHYYCASTNNCLPIITACYHVFSILCFLSF